MDLVYSYVEVVFNEIKLIGFDGEYLDLYTPVPSTHVLEIKEKLHEKMIFAGYKNFKIIFWIEPSDVKGFCDYTIVHENDKAQGDSVEKLQEKLKL